METIMKRRISLRIRNRNRRSNNSSSSFCNRVLNMVRNIEMKRRRSLRIINRITDNGCFFDGNDLVLVHIFSRLPVKSLMRFKCVSKHWKAIITHDKCLVKLHEAHRPKVVTSFLVCPTWFITVSETRPCPFPGRVEIRSLMFSPEDLRFDGDEQGVTLFRSHNNVVLNAGYNVLPPVRGLVCFVNCDQADSFLICNPCTGEKTPWIRASVSELFISDFGHQQVAASPENLRLGHRYMFAFGYDPITRQHKVLCLYVITVFKMGRRLFDNVGRRKVICGVLTLGENNWREIDSPQVPLRVASSKKSVYVNGYLCWIRYRPRPMNSEVVVFDVGREIFRVISIPNCIPQLYSFYNTGKLVNELVEFDENFAILVQEKGDQLNMWIYIENNDNAGVNWIKETIRIPYRWDELINLDFKAIAGTKLAILKFIKFRQQEQYEYLLYYNREEKKYYRNRHESLFHTYAAGARYQITPFVETLLPVQTTQDGEEIN